MREQYPIYADSQSVFSVLGAGDALEVNERTEDEIRRRVNKLGLKSASVQTQETDPPSGEDDLVDVNERKGLLLSSDDDGLSDNEKENQRERANDVAEGPAGNVRKINRKSHDQSDDDSEGMFSSPEVSFTVRYECTFWRGVVMHRMCMLHDTLFGDSVQTLCGGFVMYVVWDKDLLSYFCEPADTTNAVFCRTCSLLMAEHCRKRSTMVTRAFDLDFHPHTMVHDRMTLEEHCHRPRPPTAGPYLKTATTNDRFRGLPEPTDCVVPHADCTCSSPCGRRSPLRCRVF